MQDADLGVVDGVDRAAGDLGDGVGARHGLADDGGHRATPVAAWTASTIWL